MTESPEEEFQSLIEEILKKEDDMGLLVEISMDILLKFENF